MNGTGMLLPEVRHCYSDLDSISGTSPPDLVRKTRNSERQIRSPLADFCGRIYAYLRWRVCGASSGVLRDTDCGRRAKLRLPNRFWRIHYRKFGSLICLELAMHTLVGYGRRLAPL